VKTAEEWADLWLKQIPRNPKTFALLPRPGDPETLVELVCLIQADVLRHAANGAEKICDNLTAATLRQTANELDPK